MTDTQSKITPEQFDEAIQIMKKIDDFRQTAKYASDNISDKDEKLKTAYKGFSKSVQAANTLEDYYVPKQGRGKDAKENVESIVYSSDRKKLIAGYDDVLERVLLPYIYTGTYKELSKKYGVDKVELDNSVSARKYKGHDLPKFQIMPSFLVEKYFDTIAPVLQLKGRDVLRRYFGRAAEVKLLSLDTFGMLGVRLSWQKISDELNEDSPDDKLQTLITYAEVEYGHALIEYIDDAQYYDKLRRKSDATKAKQRFNYGSKVHG